MRAYFFLITTQLKTQHSNWFTMSETIERPFKGHLSDHTVYNINHIVNYLISKYACSI